MATTPRHATRTTSASGAVIALAQPAAVNLAHGTEMNPMWLCSNGFEPTPYEKPRSEAGRPGGEPSVRNRPAFGAEKGNLEIEENARMAARGLA